jgi:hypothetical protein
MVLSGGVLLVILGHLRYALLYGVRTPRILGPFSQ